jgi:meso-butanediol dehydrogenase/(S,S)-butanediol dehydrogenase/diacetyl reductase
MVGIDLSGKVAIVTGAGRGLGRASALKFAEAGADVVIVDVLKENALAVAKEAEAFGVKSMAFDTDVTDYDAVDKMVDEVVAKFGKLDIMFNNAGVNVIVKFVDTTLEQMKWATNVNYFGVYNGCKVAVKQMQKQNGGVILNTSSNAGVFGAADHAPYTPTKFAVRGLTQTMALELGSDNIRVNAICPGIVRTQMWEQNLVEYVVGDDNEEGIKERRDEYFDQVVDKFTPLKRPVEEEDIANACLFLVSDLAKNITGQSILVNAGIGMS